MEGVGHAAGDALSAVKLGHRLRSVRPKHLRQAIWREEAISARKLRVLDVDSVMDNLTAFCGIPAPGKGSGIDRWRNDMRRQARLRMYEVILKVDFKTSLPFGDESFDIVVCREALSNHPEGRRFFGEFHRLLGSGGIVFLCGAQGDLYENQAYSEPKEGHGLRTPPLPRSTFGETPGHPPTGGKRLRRAV